MSSKLRECYGYATPDRFYTYSVQGEGGKARQVSKARKGKSQDGEIRTVIYSRKLIGWGQLLEIKPPYGISPSKIASEDTNKSSWPLLVLKDVTVAPKR